MLADEAGVKVEDSLLLEECSLGVGEGTYRPLDDPTAMRDKAPLRYSNQGL